MLEREENLTRASLKTELVFCFNIAIAIATAITGHTKSQ